MDEGRRNDFGGLPPSQARRVDAACRCFEADWRAGRAPQIEQYLGGVEGLERAALLRELLALELELRRDRGERPDPSDYRRRFPDHVELVDPIFDEGAERAPAPDDPVPSTISLRPRACTSPSELTLSYVVAGFDRTLQSASPEDHEQLQAIFAPGRVLQPFRPHTTLQGLKWVAIVSPNPGGRMRHSHYRRAALARYTVSRAVRLGPPIDA